MNSDFLKFLRKSTIVSFILFAAGVILFKFFIPDFYQAVFPFLLLLFYLLSLILQYSLYKIAAMNMRRFSGWFMFVTMMKLFVLIIFSFIYILANKGGAIAFIAVFFFLYIVFSVLEIHDILKVTAKK